jgi:carbon storage regulator CsrA
MLALSRRIEESVIVDGLNSRERAVKVTVLKITGRSVLLGFEANADFPVHRSEVWERIRSGDGNNGP